MVEEVTLLISISVSVAVPVMECVGVGVRCWSVSVGDVS